MNLKSFPKLFLFSKTNSTKTVTKKVDNINLPKYILLLMEYKSAAKKHLNKTKSKNSKTLFNRLNKLVSQEIVAFKEEKLDREFQAILKSNPNESKFWKKIREIDSSSVKTKQVPYLISDGNKIDDDQGKCNIFSSKLESFYKPYSDPNFDNSFKETVDNFVQSNGLFLYDNNDLKHESEFSLNELEK